MTDVRALAAHALAEVALHGASLREVMARSLPRLADARDRAFATALVNEGARWWLRFDPALEALMARPLPLRDEVIRTLLVLGLVQIEVMHLPEHAAVAASVDAARALKRERHAGLVNAVLRRWLREAVPRRAALDARPTTRHAFPDWLDQAIRADWPEEHAAIVQASNQPVPPMLRVNRRRMGRAEFLRALAPADVEARAHAWLPDAIELAAHRDITALPGFAEGWFSVQDGAAQTTADLVAPENGMRVLDACAAPGGKAAHLLERHALELIALDHDATRLARVDENLARLGLGATLIHADATRDAWWDGRPFERILIDAPCSATGVIRRHPDIKLHRRPGDIDALARVQRALLAALWPMLAPGGRLVYASCSLLRRENAHVVADFLRTHDAAQTRTAQLARGRKAGDGWQLLPGIDGVDGMFHAVLEKSP